LSKKSPLCKSELHFRQAPNFATLARYATGDRLKPSKCRLEGFLLMWDLYSKPLGSVPLVSNQMW
jgi:hypothetical protein